MRAEFFVRREGNLYRKRLVERSKGDGMIRKVERVEICCRMERSLCD